MTDKIADITPEQEAQIADWTARWNNYGISTTPTQEAKLKDAIVNLFNIVLKEDDEKPEAVIKAQSPHGATIMASYGEHIVELARQGYTKRDILDVCNPKYGEEFYETLDQIEDQNLFENYANLHPKSPCQQKFDNINFTSTIQKVYGGTFYVSWPAYISFLRDVMGWESDLLEGMEFYEIICQEGGWVIWEDNCVVYSTKPHTYKQDEEERLHCEDGPAVQYNDGWSVYAWHGTSIPEDWVGPNSKLNANIALTWENIEERRCACEILGWDKIIDELGGRVIDDDGDPEIGVLIEVDLPDIGKERFLRVQCGTGRSFALPVPLESETALEAQAWTWGLELEDFTKPEVRT